MRLIDISDNVLVNPEEISAVVQERDFQTGLLVVYVIVSGEKFKSSKPVQELLSTIKNSGEKLNKQFVSL